MPTWMLVALVALGFATGLLLARWSAPAARAFIERAFAFGASTWRGRFERRGARARERFDASEPAASEGAPSSVAAPSSAALEATPPPSAAALEAAPPPSAAALEATPPPSAAAALAAPPSAGAPEATRGLARACEGASPSNAEAAQRASSLVAVPADAAVRFDALAPRGTRSAELAQHAPEWRAEMAAVGERFAEAGVSAVVFVHGTFAGNDPLSASRVVERALPSIGPQLARTLRRKTRDYIVRVLGDFGNFGTSYVRLFESAIGERSGRERIPCTEFVWSSENHHVGRLEGALGLVRTLATHAELAPHDGASPRLLLIGHSHAAQVFALVTQLFARSIATEAIFDIARARGLDVAGLETDLATLEGAHVDFVTFGAPARYAWATVMNVRALHVIAVAPDGPRGALSGDWIRRLGVDGSDFPPIGGEDRRVNAALAGLLGSPGFAPARLASALRAGGGLPANGELVFVDYGDKGLSGAVSTGLGHGAYTRFDAMLFHAKLVVERLYPAPRAEAESTGSVRAAPAPAEAAADGPTT